MSIIVLAGQAQARWCRLSSNVRHHTNRPPLMSEFTDFVSEQLSELHGIGRNPFFGGTALSCQGTQFAMVMLNRLYFVVDSKTRLRYEKMGSTCFSYLTKRGRVQVKKYFEVPSEKLESPEELLALAKEAIVAAESLKQPTNRRSQ